VPVPKKTVSEIIKDKAISITIGAIGFCYMVCNEWSKALIRGDISTNKAQADHDVQ
jgi:hypothetical protein